MKRVSDVLTQITLKVIDLLTFLGYRCPESYQIRARKERRSRWFTVRDFEIDIEKERYTCPAGRSLYVKNENFKKKGYKAIAFMAKKIECMVCKLRDRCLRNPEKTEVRQVHFFYGKDKDERLFSRIIFMEENYV